MTLCRVVLLPVLLSLVACSVGCDNPPPTVLDVAVISDTNLAAGPYEVRVVAFDEDRVTGGRIDWRARAEVRDETLTQKSSATLAIVDDVVDRDGQRLLSSIPGQALGTEVQWSAVVCDGKGACTRSPLQTFVVGKLPSNPRIDSLAPTEGPESGGTRVEVRGGDFRAGAVVRFGALEAAHTEHIAADLLLATTPPHAPGDVEVRVENPDGAAVVAPDAFTYLPSPRLRGLDPTTGPTAGGTHVTLDGERFTAGVRVLFDGVPCRNLVRASDDALACDTPPGAAGFVDVEVRHETRGRSVLVDAFLYVAPPRVDGVSPPGGPDTGGTDIVVVGSGFSDGAEVFIDGASCSDVVVLSETELSCVTPPGEAGVGDVLVINPDGQDGLLPGGFDYEGPPVVVAVVPAESPLVGGVTVRVLGSGFRDSDVVRFGGAPAEVLELVSDAELRVLVPAAPTDPLVVPDSGELRVDVEVQRQDPIDDRSGFLIEGFVYFWPPQITGVVPDRGPTAGGTSVVVQGRFFRVVADEDLLVFFDDAPCTSVVRLSSTAIACVTPPGDAGPADVRVQNHPLSEGTGTEVFFYVPPPRVDSVTPREGPTFGGEAVTVRGAGFSPGAIVFIDGAPCLDLVFVSDTELTCTSPPGEEGLADVRVLNPDAQEDTAPALYEYLGVAVSPDHGTIVGFTRVRVRSAGIAPGAVVTFGGTIADCVFVSSRELVCETPAHAAGPVTVQFTNPDGTTEDGDDAFDYRVFADRTAGRIDGLGNNANHVEAADVDSDGDLDVVVAMGAVAIPQDSFLFRNDGTGDFSRTALLEATANKIDFGDFNGDGAPDLVFGATSGAGALLMRNADGSFVSEDDIVASRGAFDALLVDLVGDERDDVLILTIGCDPFLDQEEQPNCDSFADGLDVLFESAAGGFIDRSPLIPHDADWTHDHKMVATDLDLDGDLDIVIVVNNDPYFSAENRILRNRVDEGDGFVAETPAELTGVIGDLYDIVAGDLDGDGDDDVITTICAQPFGSGEVVLENIGGDLFQDDEALPGGTEDCDVGTLAHDVDADGDLDLFFGGTRNARYNLKLYINRGDGTFVDGTDALPDLGTPRLQVNHLAGGDFDRDGDADVVVAAGAPYETPGQPGQVLLFLLE